MKTEQVTKKIQSIYEKHLEDMTRKHSKVLQTRFDIRYPIDGRVAYNPKQIRDFSEYMTRDLKRNNPLPTGNQKRSPGKKGEDKNQVDPRVIWVKEQHDNSSHPHYHCLTLVNGNAKQSTYDVHKRAERQWDNALGLKNSQGLVDFCDKNGQPSIMLNRNNKDFPEQIEAAKQQASYLSKAKGKEKCQSRLWKVGGTRLPKDKN